MNSFTAVIGCGVCAGALSAMHNKYSIIPATGAALIVSNTRPVYPISVTAICIPLFFVGGIIGYGAVESYHNNRK